VAGLAGCMSCFGNGNLDLEVRQLRLSSLTCNRYFHRVQLLVRNPVRIPGQLLRPNPNGRSFDVWASYSVSEMEEPLWVEFSGARGSRANGPDIERPSCLCRGVIAIAI
jgi:hypothetical protein